MGLSHFVATGDEASPAPIAVAREGTLWVSETLVGRTAADRASEPHKNRARTAKTPPWTPPGWTGISCIQSDVRMEPPVGFEPTTFSLRGKCSTPELRRHTIYDLYGAYTIANISRDYRAGRI